MQTLSSKAHKCRTEIELSQWATSVAMFPSARTLTLVVVDGYLNSSPQLRHLCGSLTNRNNRERRQVNGAPITATRIAHNGTVPFITLVELHRTQTLAGTTDGRAFGCGAG